MSWLFERSDSGDMSLHRVAPKCDLCGRFAKRVTLVFTSGPEPEPDYAACDRCMGGKP